MRSCRINLPRRCYHLISRVAHRAFFLDDAPDHPNSPLKQGLFSLAVAMLSLTSWALLPELKSTPFAHWNEPADPDRVNVWPLVYAQRDCGSGVFNLFSYSDEHVALHPLFSVYSSRPGASYDSYNALLGWFHHDVRGECSWLFPCVWGRKDGYSYFDCYPLWCTRRDGFDSPLFCYGDHGWFCPPLLTGYSGKPRRFMSIPLLTSYDEGDKSYTSLTLLSRYWPETGGFFILPLLSAYLPESNTVGTPLWFSGDWGWFVPPLLSGSFNDGKSFYSLPLLSGYSSQHDTFYSLLYCGGDWGWLCPALLSGYASGSVNRYYSVPLLSKYETSSEGSSWFSLPLLSYGSNKKTETGSECTQVAIPLLSGLVHEETDGKTDNRDIVLLGSYYHRHVHEEKKDYERYSVLWKVWDWRREDGNVSLDCLPGISYDDNRDGSSSFSFLWRFYRYSRSTDGKRKLDLLYCPIIRE